MAGVSDFVQVAPDGDGKKISNAKIGSGSGAVYRQDTAFADPEDIDARARVRNAPPASDDYGVVVRLLGPVTLAEPTVVPRHHMPLGGSRSVGLPLAVGAQNAIDYYDIELDGDELDGWIVRARVEVRTSDPLVGVTPRIWNMTADDIAAGGAESFADNLDYAGILQKQTLILNILPGLNTYRLQASAGSEESDVFVIGHLELLAP